MTYSPRRYVVPTSDILNQFPYFQRLMDYWMLSWEDVIYAASDELMTHINQGGFNDLIDTAGSDAGVELDLYSDHMANNFLESFSIESIDFDGDAEGVFKELAAVLKALFIRILDYIKHLFKIGVGHGMISEIIIERLVGRDLLFRLSTLALSHQ